MRLSFVPDTSWTWCRGAPSSQPDHETGVPKIRLVVGEWRLALPIRARLPVDAVSRGHIPFHGGSQSGVDVGPALGDPAELERAAGFHPAAHRNGLQVLLQLVRRVRETLHYRQRGSRSWGPGVNALRRPAP